MRLPNPLRPFQRAARPFTSAAAGMLALLPGLVLLAVPWQTYNPTNVLLILVSVVVPFGIIAYCGPWLTAVQRERIRAIMRVEIPEVPEESGSGLRSRAGRRQVVYHLVTGPLIVLGNVLAAALAAAAIIAGLFYAWMPFVWSYGDTVRGPVFNGENPKVLFNTGLMITLGGLTGLYVSALLFIALARTDVHAASVLLGPSREELLARKVEDLTESRAGVVDAADAERRRIERDLHDGAQQRLVSLAVNLGLAKATLTDLPEDARLVIEKAHYEAKEAIEELSSLVRGLHPAVLDDRGLDAALSGVAARAPLPVRLTVDLPSRVSATVEAIAYFVVSEALANIVKHAQASRTDVTVEQIGGILLIVVSDDGLGGADPSRGTGLDGLAKRVASVDGKFSLSSPVGGPTVLSVELPCAL
ncbi:MAG: two-component system sensor kinase [Actinomycetia bacterium]|nr:two-component system sensor kinase [Actinomycetes bacterium]